MTGSDSTSDLKCFNFRSGITARSREYTDTDGRRRYEQYCAECERVSKLRRKCNRCRNEFKPTCENRFLCCFCYRMNVRNDGKTGNKARVLGQRAPEMREDD